MANNRTTEAQLVDLFIMRTNIARRTDFLVLRNDLEKMEGFHWCTIDLEDCDKVLRVECENASIDKIVERVAAHGFLCQELED